MKFLKNNIFLLALLGVMFSCDPLEETYDELDAIEDVDGKDAGISIEYTLSSDDYSSVASTLRLSETISDSVKADFLDNYNAFNTTIDVQNLLAEFVNDEYPQLGKGAAVKVTYLMLENDQFVDDIASYTNTITYSLDSDDYATVSAEAGSFGFFDSETEYLSEIPAILSSAIQNASEGDVIAASFEIISVAYSTLTGETVYDEAFATSIDSFTAFDLEGDQSWGHGDSFGSTYAIMSGFSSGAQANKDWLISPQIDLSTYSGSVTLKMSQILNFQGDAAWGTNLRVVFATDYSGDIATATWQDLTFDVLPEGDNWDVFDNSSDLGAAAGETIHLGFYYESTTDDAPNWRITNLTVEAGAVPETENVNVLFQYDGAAWESVEDDAYFLRSADYNAMGEASGQPGRFDSFSESTPPENYLPVFLTGLFPFAQEGDDYILMYSYYNGETTVTRSDLYLYENGTWITPTESDQLVELTDQYVNTGTEFVFNPSVILTMVSSDYQIIVDEVIQTRPELVSSFGTGEDLYGADAFFVNFDTRLSSRLETGDDGNPLQPEYIGLSEEESTALIADRVTEGIVVFLQARFFDAQPIDGIEILYTINYATFDGNSGTGSEVFMLTDVGTFEPVVSE